MPDTSFVAAWMEIGHAAARRLIVSTLLILDPHQMLCGLDPGRS
jgi:hypothetical protein